ncbi:Endo-1,4-beta-xylanase/feruloyl esterase precursor [compost metagenome]
MKGSVVQRAALNRDITIYLPPSYPKDNVRYPVVYVQDGGHLFNPQQNDALARLEQGVANGEAEELILVGIEPNNRNDEYTPWKAKALVDKFADFGGMGSEYLSFLVNELKPYIDQEYVTNPNGETTGIIGASFGGLISIYAAYLYPNVFGKIGALSASFWYEGFLEYMQSEDIRETDRRIYMYVGTSEGVNKGTIQEGMVARTRSAHDLLSSCGFTKDRLKFVEEVGGTHDWSYFFQRFPEALQWLFKK